MEKVSIRDSLRFWGLATVAFATDSQIWGEMRIPKYLRIRKRGQYPFRTFVYHATT